MTATTERRDDWDVLWEIERSGLVGFCRRMTGCPAVAEDLAQETLLKAWRAADQLADQSRRSQWLRAIARNECLQWMRRNGREAHRLWEFDRIDEADGSGLAERLADDVDLEVELERNELADVLDRAMALLPEETRRILVDRFIRGAPIAEIARRLGLNEGAVAVRLHRGKRALRQVLTNDLREDAVAFGLVDPEAANWQETRIWCTCCGRHRLRGRFTPRRELWLTCPACNAMPGSIYHQGGSASFFAGTRGFRPAFKRVVASLYHAYPDGVSGKTFQCDRCGCVSPVRIDHYQNAPILHHYFHETCRFCGKPCGHHSLHAYVMSRPEARWFWREKPRVRTLPEREIEAAGGAAVVSSIESVVSAARLEVIVRRETFAVIAVHGALPTRIGEAGRHDEGI